MHCAREARVCQRSDQNGEARVPAFWNSLALFYRCSRSCHPEITGRAKSMKAAPARLIQQGQQRGFEVLHLLFRLGAGLGCIRGEQGTETGDLIRQSVVLSRQDRNLLLGNPGAGLGLIPLVLPKVRSITPETDGGGFCFVTHALSYNATAPRERARLHQRGCPSYRSRYRRCARRFRFCRPMIRTATPYPAAKVPATWRTMSPSVMIALANRSAI